MNKPREFWILKTGNDEDGKIWELPTGNTHHVHVIEYSAVLEAVLKEQEVSEVISTALKDTTKALKALRKERDDYRATLLWSADGLEHITSEKDEEQATYMSKYILKVLAKYPKEIK